MGCAFLGHAFNLGGRVREQVLAFRTLTRFIGVRHWLSPWIDWERLAHFGYTPAYAFLDLRIAVVAVLAQAFDHFGNQRADLAELGRAEPARRACRGAEADSRGHEWRARVERDAVLVAGQV